MKEVNRYKKRFLKGFSLLEVIITLALTAILTEALFGVFTNIYTSYITLNKKVSYSEQAKAVNNLMREEIRKAAYIEIKVSGGQVIEPRLTGGCMEVSGLLRNITVYTTSGNMGVIELRKHTMKDLQKGSYSLTYRGQGSMTQNLMSNLIQKVEVTRMPNSDEVMFESTIGTTGESEENQVVESFVESIAYKAPIK